MMRYKKNALALVRDVKYYEVLRIVFCQQFVGAAIQFSRNLIKSLRNEHQRTLQPTL